MQFFYSKNKSVKKRNGSSYWQSYSDMMAALLLVFILVMASILLHSAKIYEEKFIEQQEAREKIENQLQQLEIQEEELASRQNRLDEQADIMSRQQEQLDRIVGVKAQVIEELSDAFRESNMSVAVDPETGSIMLDSNILFDVGRSELKPEGTAFLDEFLPTYFSVLFSEEIEPYISEIIIEGHTDTTGTYMTNLKLSQERAFSVSSYIFDTFSMGETDEIVEHMRQMITANGRAWNDLIYNDDGTENMDASRRVEFKFRLKDDEMIDAMTEILKEGE